MVGAVIQLARSEPVPAVQLLEWQLDCGFISEGVKTADYICENHLDPHPNMIPYYQRMLDLLVGSEFEKTVPGNDQTVRHILHRLAEETSGVSKEEALILFENILNKYGSIEAEKVAKSILQLGLNKALPLRGNLVVGDAWYLTNQFQEALNATTLRLKMPGLMDNWQPGSKNYSSFLR